MLPIRNGEGTGVIADCCRLSLSILCFSCSAVSGIRCFGSECGELFCVVCVAALLKISVKLGGRREAGAATGGIRCGGPPPAGAGCGPIDCVMLYLRSPALLVALRIKQTVFPRNKDDDLQRAVVAAVN